MQSFRRLLSTRPRTGAAAATLEVNRLVKLIDQEWGRSNQNILPLLSDVREKETFRGVVATYVRQREFQKATEVFKSGPRECRSDQEAMFAAMLAYSELKTPYAAKQVLMTFNNKKQTVEVQVRCLEILLLGYCKADRLDYVEGILFEWLSRSLLLAERDGGSATETVGQNMLKALDIRKRAKVAKDLEDLLVLRPDLPLPGLSTWEQVCKMYAGRFAWNQCLRLLECVVTNKSLISPSPSPPPTSSLSSSAAPSSSSSSTSSSSTFEKQRLFHDQFGKLYHYTFRALCDGGKFLRAISLLEEMRSSNQPLGHVYLLTHLLKYYRFREGGLDINKDMLEFVMSGIEEGPSGKMREGNAIDTSIGLSSAFVSLLCLRGQPEAAEEIARAGGVSGTVRPSSLAMVINSYVKAGKCNKAEELFWEMRGEGVLDDYHATLAYHQVCEGLRHSKQHQQLSVFMSRFSREVSLPFS